MNFQETILCSSGASSSSQGLGSITVHDFQSGSLLASFKQTCADVNSTVALQTRNGQGGYILAAQPDKSIINAYYFQKDQVALKIVPPEKLSCITISPTGSFCAGGTAQGRIYLWEVSSGILFNVWDAHYRKVSVLRFTRDGAALISGSEDSGVSVWLTSSLLDNETQNEIPAPYCAFSDHTLPITDIFCGVGIFPQCRVLTSSTDHSVKLWDMASEKLITTFIFPGPISSLLFEAAERFFFATGPIVNSETSSIHKINLFRRQERSGRSAEEAVGGGASDAIRLDMEKSGAINVGQRVTSMAFSLSQSTLLVGTSAGDVRLYDVASHQLLRTISPLKDKSQGLSITHIECMLKPPDLIGNISLGLNVSGVTSAKDVLPTYPIVPFQRVRDGKSRTNHEVLMMLTPPDSDEAYSDPTDYSVSEALKDQAMLLGLSISTNGTKPQPSAQAQQERVRELEGEVEQLRSQLAKAKGINDAMWEAVVQRTFAPGNENSRRTVQ